VTENAQPIRVAVVGTGYFGSGLLRRLALLDGFDPRVAANRTIEHGVAALRRAGVAVEDIVITRDGATAAAALGRGQYVATDDLQLPASLDSVDLVAETTGDVLVGAQIALSAIQAGKHVVAANPETQATVGTILNDYARRAGVVYSDVDGDEPGLLKNLFDDCREMGLEIVVAGNCKGVLKRYATPATQAQFAAEHNLKPWIATAAADGTKLNFELTVVANATGLTPRVRGMHGPSTDPSHIIEDLERLGLFDGGPYVDYVHGLGSGVFAIVYSDDAEVRSDFRYLKMGEGPHYLFHRPNVLIHYQAPRSIARAVRFRQPTVAPLGRPLADTIAFAKRDLSPGQPLDGIGGCDLFGMIVPADQARAEQLLPVGLAQYARLRRAIRQDEPIGYADVDFEVDNIALELRRQQDALFRTPQPLGSALPA
jgi:predicted homoserine dehydrogenase-like protein